VSDETTSGPPLDIARDRWAGEDEARLPGRAGDERAAFDLRAIAERLAGHRDMTFGAAWK